MDESTANARSALQTLETTYFALEYEVLRYTEEHVPERTEEVEQWLQSLHPFSVEERTYHLRLFVTEWTGERQWKLRLRQLNDQNEQLQTSWKAEYKEKADHLYVQKWHAFRLAHEQMKRGQRQ